MDRNCQHRIIATGEFNSLVKDNRQFAAHLATKGISQHCEIRAAVFGHDWSSRKDSLRRFLP